MSISKPLVNASYQYLPSSPTFLKLFVSPTSTLRVKNTSSHILVILLINSIILIVIWNLFTSGHYTSLFQKAQNQFCQLTVIWYGHIGHSPSVLCPSIHITQHMPADVIREQEIHSETN